MPSRPKTTSAARSADLAALLLRTAEADRAAFAEVYRLTAPQLFGLAIRMLGQRTLAEEILQEVFVTIWTKAGSFDPERGAPQSWMIGVLRNRCLDTLRVRRPETPLDAESGIDSWTDPSPSPLDLALRNADGRALSACLDRLEPGPRDAIIRIYYEGLTHAELADRLPAPLGTIKSWVRRGLGRLKDCLDA